MNKQNNEYGKKYCPKGWLFPMLGAVKSFFNDPTPYLSKLVKIIGYTLLTAIVLRVIVDTSGILL